MFLVYDIGAGFFLFFGPVLFNSVLYVNPRLHRIVSFQLIIWPFSESYADLYAGGCRTFSPLFQADRSLTVGRYFHRLTALPGVLNTIDNVRIFTRQVVRDMGGEYIRFGIDVMSH